MSFGSNCRVKVATMGKTIRILHGVLAICAAAALPALVVCTAPLEAPVLNAYEAQARNLQVQYQFVGDRMYLTWQEPDGGEAVSFYIIHRYQMVEGSDEEQNPTERFVDASAREYYDVIDLGRTEYYYYIVPALVDGSDTLTGRKSPTAVVQGGMGVSFTINDGATKTSGKACTLVLRDPTVRVATVRFTQRGSRFFFKNYDTAYVSTHSVPHLSATDVSEMVTKGLYNATSKALEAGVGKGFIPDFDAYDPENSSSSAIPRTDPRWAGGADSTALEVAWTLSDGIDEKRVWAEVTLGPADGNIVDTLDYGFPIAPYRVRVRLANRRVMFTLVNGQPEEETWEGPADADLLTWNQQVSDFTIDQHNVFFGKTIKFNVLIDVDSSIDPVFEYWLVTPRLHGEFLRGAPADTGAHWLETKHRIGQLTGVGPAHDEDYIYEYSIDPEDPEGFENLSQLTVVANNQGYPFVERTQTLTGGPDLQFKRFSQMSKTQQNLKGKKVFFIAFKFTGREFLEPRYVMSDDNIYDETSELKVGLVNEVNTYMYLDYFQPKATLEDASIETYLTNGDTLTRPFDFVLDPSSVNDQGYCRVTGISLVIAKEPAPGTILESGQSWSPSLWNFSGWDLDSVPPMTLQDLYNQQIAIYDFPVEVPLRVIKNVAWRDIDITSWSSGRYYVGLVARDEFGNEGLASVNFNSTTKSTNPFQITVLSGR